VIVAGVDIGNATTEVVVGCQRHDSTSLVAAGRVPTRGVKGSAASLRAAVRLIRRLERSVGAPVNAAVVAPLRAVETSTVQVPGSALPTGRLWVAVAGVRTPGGRGHCIGRPMRLDGHGPPAGRVVALAPQEMGYAAVAAHVSALIDNGIDVGAVVVEGDEAVLVANRLGVAIPVVDQVTIADLQASEMLAVEVREPGRALQLLTDPLALSAGFGLRPEELTDAVSISRSLVDRSNAVVALGGRGPGRVECAEAWMEFADGRRPWPEGWQLLASRRVGAAQAYGLTEGGTTRVDDLFGVDLGAVADRAGSRRGTVASRAYVLAGLRSAGTQDQADVLAAELGIDIWTAKSEPAAARAGALTTRGSRPDDIVIDLGAGTIDAIGSASEVVAAGAGELLTQAVAATLGVTRSAAEWVKRGPCLRIASGGQRFEAEDGSRGFIECAIPPAATGMLVVDGPAGLLPFDREHTPSEWRALRLRLKEAVFGGNLRRVLREIGMPAAQVLIVGGPADDDELLGVLARSLPESVIAGRSRVGETLVVDPRVPPLGSRYAVALGLCLHGIEVA